MVGPPPALSDALCFLQEKLIYHQKISGAVLEVESKYLSPGNDKIEKTLQRIGAVKTSEEEMEDIYYRHPVRDFGKTDEAFRLRKTGNSSELTYKGPRMHMQHTKAREEITMKMENPLAMQRIVERLGFAEFMTIKKRRVNYIYDKIRIAVDDVDGLGEYVELELITEEPKRAERLIEQLRAELALSKMEPRTYLELTLQKAKD